MNRPGFVRTLLRLAKAKGRAELETLLFSNLDGVKAGKALTSWTVNGKSYVLSLLPGMSPADALEDIETALTLFDSLTARGTLDAYLGTPAHGTALVTIGGGCGDVY